MIKAIIFDCWNTLFYTNLEPHPFKEFAEKIEKDIHNYDFLKIFEKHFMLERHNKIEVPIKQILSELDIEASDKLVKELKKIYMKAFEYQEAFPETLNILKKLKKRYRLGLITNTEHRGLGILEKKFKIKEIFDVVLASYEMMMMKPNPKVFKLMLKKLDIKKDEAIMVGDSLRDDAEAAEINGIKGILIDRRNRYPNYKNRITSLEEVERFL